MAVSTDKQKIEELLTRGVENIYPSREFLEKELMSGRRLTLYVGYDPTAPTFHIGHAITILKLRQFQELGHDIIMLIGDFTAMIGDPTDKSATRQRLTHAEAFSNSELYQKQAATILKFAGANPARVLYNNDWLGKMKFSEVIELASNFTVQQMLERDMFEKRIEEEKPIYLHEFLYPLMQGYDSVAMNVDGEVGGNDQTFNMLAGRTLMKAIQNKEKFALSTKLLVDNTGKKMGKSEGNMIALSDSPEDMFGKVMRWTDGMIARGFELCTRVPIKEIKIIEESIANGANPRDYKLRLAYEITKTFLGEKAAEKGKEFFSSVIQNKDKPEEISEIKLSAYDIVTALVEGKLVPSKSEARRAIEQGGVKLNDEKVVVPTQAVKAGDIVQKGKRFYVKVI